VAPQIDTHRLIHNLQKEGGFDEKQAEAVVYVIQTGLDVSYGELATKADVELLRSDFKALEMKFDGLESKLHLEISGLRSEFHAELANLHRKLMMQTGGMIAIATAILGLLIQLQ